MSAAQHGHRPDPSAGLHVATIPHGGLLWDAFLQFADDPRQPSSYRARIRFERAGPDGGSVGAETALIIIEDSYEEAVAKARAMDDRQLQNLLRSALPDEAS